MNYRCFEPTSTGSVADQQLQRCGDGSVSNTRFGGQEEGYSERGDPSKQLRSMTVVLSSSAGNSTSNAGLASTGSLISSTIKDLVFGRWRSYGVLRSHLEFLLDQNQGCSIYGMMTCVGDGGYGGANIGYSGPTEAYGNQTPYAGYVSGPPSAPRSLWTNQAPYGYGCGDYGANAGYGTIALWNAASVGDNAASTRGCLELASGVMAVLRPIILVNTKEPGEKVIRVGTTSQFVPPTDGLGRIVCPTGLRPTTTMDLLGYRDRRSSSSSNLEV
ncbi:hypothetical protein NE237_009314 [Protea cynaroides]|uniref:Uncharacterized protein n=1 Tax=Protea cynaroides TaxID=273540 RepID=A0A9Q0KYB1_9MAGN|nr:hypothetical protein NE237_009314 [Protea cynaroides]